MDVLAVYKAVSEARKHALEGMPTLIEAITYRFGPHSMSGDDPSKYRTKEESGEWEERDPLVRFRKYLTAKGLWSDEQENKVIEEAREYVNGQIKKAEETAKMNIPDLIDTMFETTPPHLEEQKAWFTGKGGK
jgi:pyruvate dehydrogenase E1 component alpha subunit